MVKAVIAIHGGAGAITRAQLTPEQEKRYIDALYAIVETGQKMLEAGESALKNDKREVYNLDIFTKLEHHE